MRTQEAIDKYMQKLSEASEAFEKAAAVYEEALSMVESGSVSIDGAELVVLSLRQMMKTVRILGDTARMGAQGTKS